MRLNGARLVRVGGCSFICCAQQATRAYKSNGSSADAAWPSGHIDIYVPCSLNTRQTFPSVSFHRLRGRARCVAPRASADAASAA